VRSATGASVAGVARIEQTIGEINAIAGSIAAAVEEQGSATAEIARNVAETASAANELTNHATEVSTEADQTSKHAAAVREDAVALDTAVDELRHTVIRVVRTSTTEVDRRQVQRRPCHIDATINGQGQSGTASIHDISETGCFAATKLRFQPGHVVDIGPSGTTTRMSGSVIALAEAGLHIAFTGKRFSAADADHISLTTIVELVTLTKGDHIAFVKRVADAVVAQDKLPPAQLATHDLCRLGRGYDSVSDSETLALTSFKTIAELHLAVHERGRKALAAVIANDMKAEQHYISEMWQQSEQVLRRLDEFGRAFPSTIGSDRPTVVKVA
jgi:PilZ domain